MNESEVAFLLRLMNTICPDGNLREDAEETPALTIRIFVFHRLLVGGLVLFFDREKKRWNVGYNDGSYS